MQMCFIFRFCCEISSFSDATLCSGDHVSWHTALDFQHSFIQQMLITDDPQLPQLNAPFGYVNFIQVKNINHIDLRTWKILIRIFFCMDCDCIF